jgi:hypothetical protein
VQNNNKKKGVSSCTFPQEREKKSLFYHRGVSIMDSFSSPKKNQTSTNATVAVSINCLSEGTSSDVSVPVTTVSSVDEFRAVFSDAHSATGEKQDAFLLCFEQPADGVTADGLRSFERSVEEAARRYHAHLRLFLWNCTSAAFASAKAQLDKQPGHPLLLIVFRGAIADTIRDASLAEMTSVNVPRLCSRLASFQVSAKPAHVADASPRSTAAGSSSCMGVAGDAVPPPSSPSHLSVDVAKMVGMGKGLMAERKPFYAEKFFAKALQTLDAVAGEVDHFVSEREEYDGSLALCLAWAGLAQLVQGTYTVDNPYLSRLRQTARLRDFSAKPLSDACRALATWDLMQAAPRPWSEAECSETKLRAALQANPRDAVSRSLLVVTLFLSGDVERAMTEALKLHMCGDPYGRLALRQICTFLGRDHALVTRLGIPALLGPQPG